MAQRAVDANDSRLSIEDSTLRAPDGIVVDDFDGTVQIAVTNTAIDAIDIALRAARQSSISMDGGTLHGSVAAETSSLITLDGVMHLGNAGQNHAGVASNLRLVNGSTLQGDVVVEEFGNLAILDTSSLQGSLTCSSGGNAYCAPPPAVSGTVSGCALCP